MEGISELTSIITALHNDIGVSYVKLNFESYRNYSLASAELTLKEPDAKVKLSTQLETKTITTGAGNMTLYKDEDGDWKPLEV